MITREQYLEALETIDIWHGQANKITPTPISQLRAGSRVVFDKIWRSNKHIVIGKKYKVMWVSKIGPSQSLISSQHSHLLMMADHLHILKEVLAAINFT